MNKRQKTAIGASIVGSMLLGGAIGASFLTSATAATDTPSDSSTSAPDVCSENGRPGDRRHGADHRAGGHGGRDGAAELLLTGDKATKVTAAVKARYPEAVIHRVETDTEGAAYEAHISRADGTRATVYLDSSFTITDTETGHGH